jgi:hypothetical protein
VCICPSDGGVRIEFARVRKALSRAFYNCCYYHLIKILRTLFLRLFDTHARTHAHANTYTHILYMSTRARACVCSKTFWVARRGTRGETSTREIVYIYIYTYIYIIYNNIRENLTANPTALDVIEYRGGPASDLTHALPHTHTHIHIYTYI